jgi:hypothetical protein
VTMVPLSDSKLNNFGTAVISFDLASVASNAFAIHHRSCRNGRGAQGASMPFCRRFICDPKSPSSWRAPPAPFESSTVNKTLTI